MASNISNDGGNNEVVSFQAMMTQLGKIENGTSNLTPDRQIQLIDTLQTQVNDMLMKLKQQVSRTRAQPTASVAYPSYGLSQVQGSDWEDINLHDAGSYWTGPSSFGNMSSYSTDSTISARSNSSRQRRPSSSRVTNTTSSVSSASTSSVQEGPSITQFVRAICDTFKSLWQQAEVQGQGSICKAMFYFLKNIVMSFFGGPDNSDTAGNRPSLRYVFAA